MTQYADRVLETTTTTGTGTVTLGGAMSSYRTFSSAFSDGDKVTYCIHNGSEWEVGRGTYTASGTTLSRDTVIASSNANAAVNFSAGTKNVFATVLAADLLTAMPGVFVLTDGATISVDASKGNNFRVTLGGNRTLANPTNMRDSQVLNFRILQDGTGSRTLAYGTKYKFAGGTAPVLSTAASAKDFMSCQYDATDDMLFCVLNKDFK